MPLERCDALMQDVARPRVMTRAPHEVLPGCHICDATEVLDRTDVLALTLERDARIHGGVLLADLERRVRRCVVRQDDLEVRVVLGTERVECRLEEALLVIDGDPDRDQRDAAHAVYRPRTSSAVWIALSEAPLRRLSPHANRVSPLGRTGLDRTRPTRTSSMPVA